MLHKAKSSLLRRTLLIASFVTLLIPILSYASHPERILIVDDDDMILEIIPQFITLADYPDNETALNGEEAFAKIVAAYEAGKPFSAVISDWEMPKMNGFQLLEKLRTDSRFKSLPFLFHTGYANADSTMKERTDLNFSGFIPKPGKMADLKSAIEGALCGSAVSKLPKTQP